VARFAKSRCLLNSPAERSRAIWQIAPHQNVTFIIHSQDSQTDDAAASLGGKAKALAALRRTGLPVPPWFAVAPQAFDASLTPAQRDALPQAKEVDEIRRVVADVRPSPEVVAAVERAINQLCPDGELVAVRSSASDEDGAEHSFAGQLDSFLFVAPDEVAEKVAAVWRSGFSERIIAYRRERGLSSVPRPPAVLVQRMVNAEAAGVAFAADPVSGRRGVAVVSAVYGLGTSLVAGESDADTWHVSREGEIIKREIVSKTTAHRLGRNSPEGVSAHPVEQGLSDKPALGDQQVRAVAELARAASRHFRRPQDIEWAYEGGRLYLLQSRPITTLPRLADPDGAPNLWDNSNIAESYGGVTTPLTFSFARRCYEEVYRQFCRMMYVPQGVIAAHDQTFRHMLGLIRGRVYYNLLNWYRVLALLPGFKVNRRFMEQMMGVKEGLPESLLSEFEQTSLRDKLRDGLNLAVTITGLVVNHFRLPRRIGEFYARLNGALEEVRRPLEQMRMDELAAYYRRLEAQLLTRWDAPLINDFFAMIFYGVLRKLVQSWCGDAEGTLQNDLIAGEGGIVSAEPAERMRAMAGLIADDEAFVTLLCDGPPEAVIEAVPRKPEFSREYKSYLTKFGDRCLDELKLESATLHDDPLPLLRSVGQFARRLKTHGPATTANIEAQLRRTAEGRVKAALKGHPLRRAVFRTVLKHARGRVRERENLRFERTRLFGRVRRIFVELGQRFYANDLLAEPRDVFYLEVEEALGFISGTATTTDLKSLAAARQAEYARHREGEPPSDRFETRGAVNQGHSFKQSARRELIKGDERKGLGCCPGVVRGRARVVTDPRGAVIEQGEILVAERTDPGWIMLFPAAAGLLVERGSLLSHSAIVSREMGLPAIVSVAGVTEWLKTGDEVEMDGSTGVVRKVAAKQHGAAGSD
jgi:rifampicin phosphotransferase